MGRELNLKLSLVRKDPSNQAEVVIGGRVLAGRDPLLALLLLLSDQANECALTGQKQQTDLGSTPAPCRFFRYFDTI